VDSVAKTTTRGFRLLFRLQRVFCGVLCLLISSPVSAANIGGTILIKKKLTRHSVTPSVSMYERGPAVPLGKNAPVGRDSDDDPLALERSRVVIYVEGPGPSNPLRLSMDQNGRRFSPELVVAPLGSTVSFPNLDPIFHNVFSLSKARQFDLGNYTKKDTRTVTFDKPGIVYVNCHLHANMAATIVITPNGWYAQADRLGGYALRDIPPGEYTIVAWHKAAGLFRKHVRITAENEIKVDFFLPIGVEAGGTEANAGN
jgi:plastocyanin